MHKHQSHTVINYKAQRDGMAYRETTVQRRTMMDVNKNRAMIKLLLGICVNIQTCESYERNKVAQTTVQHRVRIRAKTAHALQCLW